MPRQNGTGRTSSNSRSRPDRSGDPTAKREGSKPKRFGGDDQGGEKPKDHGRSSRDRDKDKKDDRDRIKAERQERENRRLEKDQERKRSEKEERDRRKEERRLKEKERDEKHLREREEQKSNDREKRTSNNSRDGSNRRSGKDDPRRQHSRDKREDEEHHKRRSGGGDHLNKSGSKDHHSRSGRRRRSTREVAEEPPEPAPGTQQVEQAQAEPAEDGGTRRKHWDRDNIATDLAEEGAEVAEEDIEEAGIKSNKAGGVGEFDYDEEDFEDYDDDDFEDEDDDDEEEEEKEDTKMDSGNYESSGRQAMEKERMARELAEVKLAMKRENTAKQHNRNKQQQPNSDDSGKGSPKDGGGDSPRKDGSRSNNKKPSSASSGLFNFSAAKERNKVQLAAGKARRRGDELLAMIRLDVVSFELLELPPVRYESFMQSFGASNAVQANTQTGDDNLEEECQTEEVRRLDKWTQNPAAMTAVTKDMSSDLLLQNIRGVGGQTDEDRKGKEAAFEFADHSNSMRLSRFLGPAGSAILTLLEEEDENDRRSDDMSGQTQKDVEFSDKVTMLNTGELAFLAKRPITSLAFAPDQPSMLLTAHGHMEMDSKKTTMSDFSFRTFLCLWNVSQPSRPSKVLVANNEVRECCFSPLKASAAFAGLADGMVCAWDLRESASSHHAVTRDEKLKSTGEWTLRSPTFAVNTTEHKSPITAVHPLAAKENNNGAEVEESDGIAAFQLLTLEERGQLLIWTVLDSRNDGGISADQHLGLAHWGTLRLVRSTVIDLCSMSDDLIYFDLASNVDGDVFVATGTGNVVHASSAQPEYRPIPRAYKPEYNCHSACRSVAFCPFSTLSGGGGGGGGDSFLLVGSDDGSVRLHATTKERPVITWPGTVDGQPVSKLLWSRSRPCVFTVLDTASRIHLWDLSSGDIYPAHTVQFQDQEIVTLALNPDVGMTRQVQLMALGMKSGRVEVHHLKQEYKSEDGESCEEELSRFLHYVSII